MLRVLSLGAGVQSSTIALMAAVGELTPMPDCAIFADTQAEPEEVYRWLEWLETQLPFPVYRVTAGNLAADSLVLRRSGRSGRIYMKGIIPAFVKNPDGTKGLLGRRCTRDYKISPIERRVREMLGGAHRRLGPCRRCGHTRREHRTDTATKAESCRGLLSGALIETRCRCTSYDPAPLVEQWIGISRDEVDRMKPAQKKWIENTWPLVDIGMTREGCLAWMQDHRFPTPPRSACEFCPFHGDDEWLRLKTEHPLAFHRAVEFERDMQSTSAFDESIKGVPFLHDSLVTLDQVDFAERTRGSHSQLNLFRNECEGMCGV